MEPLIFLIIIVALLIKLFDVKHQKFLFSFIHQITIINVHMHSHGYAHIL